MKKPETTHGKSSCTGCLTWPRWGMIYVSSGKTIVAVWQQIKKLLSIQQPTRMKRRHGVPRCITYHVPTYAKSAYMYVFNLNGEMLQSYALTQYGHGSVTVSGGTLSAGMYVYSLVVDGQIVDTKQMILTK